MKALMDGIKLKDFTDALKIVAICLPIMIAVALIWTFFMKIFNITGQQLFITLLLIYSIVMLIIQIIKDLKMQTSNYNKNFENLVSPVLAETLIDGNADLKNLIMTAIIQLNIKGNVKIINNNSIRLISRYNIEKYEQDILRIIFPNDVKVISFSDINNIFKNSAEKTYKFSVDISNIKVKILEHLDKLNIISKKETALRAILRAICIMIILIVPFILCVWNDGFDYFEVNIWVIIYYIFYSMIIGSWFLVSFSSQMSIKQLLIETRKQASLRKDPSIIILLIVIATVAISSIKLFFANKISFIFALLIIIINSIIFSRNRGIALSKYGKQERLKLLELKNYINEYSLIKDRDLKSIVVWDEYLAYATAFGIPSRIISQIYENWYNMNITIQFVSSLLPK